MNWKRLLLVGVIAFIFDVTSISFIWSTDFLDLSECAWEWLYNQSIAEESQPTNMTMEDQTPPINDTLVDNSITEEKEEWAVVSFFSDLFGSNQPHVKSEGSESEGSSVFGDWFSSAVPPEPPCPLVYAVPHHQWGPTRVYHLLYTWFMAEENTTETSPLTVEEESIPVPSHVVVLQVLAFLCLEGTVVLVLFVSVCSGWLRKKKKTASKLREDQRLQQEKKEREAAERTMKGILDTYKFDATQKDFKPSGDTKEGSDSSKEEGDSGEGSSSDDTTDGEPAEQPAQKKGDWGSRLNKYWFKEDNNTVITFTIAPLPKNLGLALDSPIHQEGINKLIKEISRLPNIQPIHHIKYSSDEEEKEEKEKEKEKKEKEEKGKGKEEKEKEKNKQVVIAQPFHKDGSLRDLIHGEDPTRDWSEKYLHDGAPLPPEKVASYGRQILKAMLELYWKSYNDVSLFPLEHVHVGNIFVVDDTCLLGGYENKLLGYRPRLYRAILANGQLPHIDVIMFGHVVYEMASGKEIKEMEIVNGKELPRLIPKEEDYSHVQDVSCRKILQYIFTQNKDRKIKHSIQEIKKNAFFSSAKPKDAKPFLDVHPVKLISGTVGTVGKLLKKPREKLSNIYVRGKEKIYERGKERKKEKQYDTVSVSDSLLRSPPRPAPSIRISPGVSISPPLSTPPSADSAEQSWDWFGFIKAFSVIVLLLIANYVIIVLLVIL